MMGGRGSKSGGSRGASVPTEPGSEFGEVPSAFAGASQDITPDEAEQISEYTGNSLANDFMRFREAYGDEPELIADMIPQIKALDSAMRKFQTKESTTVFRGMSDDKFQEVFGGPPRAGQTLRDKGFLSTTVAKNDASGFRVGAEMLGQTPKGGVVLQINVPKGTNAIYTPSIKRNLGSDNAPKKVREVILPRGKRMKITNVSNENGYKLVSVDLL